MSGIGRVAFLGVMQIFIVDKLTGSENSLRRSETLAAGKIGKPNPLVTMLAVGGFIFLHELLEAANCHCLFAMVLYQIPEAVKTRLHPAVNHMRNGTGK